MILFRLKNIVKRHTLAEFIYLLFYNLFYYSKKLFSKNISSEKDEFDTLYGTETNTIREISTLELSSCNDRYGVRYQPTDSKLLYYIFNNLQIEFDKFKFIDFGCGKGRVLLIASNYPFLEIIGIEFSPELCKIAKSNIEIYKKYNNRCDCIKCVCGDAILFKIPPEPIVCFFYNPFNDIVMKKVLENIEQSLNEYWRKIYIIYVEPVYKILFNNSSIWNLTKTERDCVIYSNI